MIILVYCFLSAYTCICYFPSYCKEQTLLWISSIENYLPEYFCQCKWYSIIVLPFETIFHIAFFLLKSKITKILNSKENSKRKVSNQMAKSKVQTHQTNGYFGTNVKKPEEHDFSFICLPPPCPSYVALFDYYWYGVTP